MTQNAVSDNQNFKIFLEGMPQDLPGMSSLWQQVAFSNYICIYLNPYRLLLCWINHKLHPIPPHCMPGMHMNSRDYF